MWAVHPVSSIRTLISGAKGTADALPNAIVGRLANPSDSSTRVVNDRVQAEAVIDATERKRREVPRGDIQWILALQP
jgi:hypothetical protein